MIELIIKASNPFPFYGGVMSLMIPSATSANRANPYPDDVGMTIVAIDPNPANQFAYYFARPGVDFPTLGNYQLQAKFSAAGGVLLFTNPFTFTVTDLNNQTTTLTLPFTRQRTGWPWMFRRRKDPWG